MSKQLKELEKELGTKLFTRSNYSINLTGAGMLLRERAEDILSLVDKTEVFFASTFWKKLQSEIGNSCIAKMALFARMVSGARRRRINPVQTG